MQTASGCGAAAHALVRTCARTAGAVLGPATKTWRGGSQVLEDDLREAYLAAEGGREVRAHHRKRTMRGDQQREEDIRMALERIRAAMKPLRSALGKFPWQSPSSSIKEKQQKVLEASVALQRERRKLWKMRDRPERTQ